MRIMLIKIITKQNAHRAQHEKSHLTVPALGKTRNRLHLRFDILRYRNHRIHLETKSSIPNPS